MKPAYYTMIAGASLLIPPVLLLRSFGQAPTALYPLPGTVLIPALFGLREGAVLIPSALFFAWIPGLFSGDDKIPRRSFVLLVVVTVANVLWLAAAWQDGIAMQGVSYTHRVSALSLLWLASLWIAFVLVRKSAPSFTKNLLLHWFMFAWFAWYAFPFFGELP